MLKEESHHLPCGVGSLRIGVAAHRRATGPSMAEPVDDPVFHHCAFAGIQVESLTEGTTPRHPPLPQSPFQLLSGTRSAQNILGVAISEYGRIIDRMVYETWDCTKLGAVEPCVSSWSGAILYCGS